MNDNAIEIQGVSKLFGKHRVLDELSLGVPRGKTFAFLGRNGAGKTTTIRMLLGLLRPDCGTIRVLGLDPQKEAVELRRRVGYLAESQTMFGWMRVEEILRFLKPFYPTWDDGLVAELLERFELGRKSKVETLSKGQGVRLGLLAALAHRPELVILDDPTLGLDPIMRKEFLRDVIDRLQTSGATVFFSSHLLYEIEPVADVVAILDKGRIVKQATTDELREHTKRLIISGPLDEKTLDLPNVLDIRRTGRDLAVTVGSSEAALVRLAQLKIEAQVVDLNLDEIFEAYVTGRRNG